MARLSDQLLTFVGLFIISVFDAGCALRCYECLSLEIAPGTSSSSIVSSLLSHKYNAGCETLSGGISSVQCPNSYAYKCSYISGDIKFNILFSDITLKIRSRSCFPTTSIAYGNGCSKSDHLESGMNTALAFLSAVTPLSKMTVDLDVCLCDSDLCDAACSGFNFNWIGGECVSWWWVVGISGGVVFVLVLCIVGCCCCCANSNRPGRTHVMPAVQNPQVMMVTTAAQPTHGQMMVNPAGVNQPGMASYPAVVNPSYGLEKAP